MTQIVDDNSVTCFSDNNSVTGFVDQDGDVIFCSSQRFFYVAVTMSILVTFAICGLV